MKALINIGSRAGGLIFVFFGVTLMIYLLVFALPGDPVRALAGDRPIAESTVEAIRAQLNLDLPIWQRYWMYLTGLFQGDFGVDFKGRSVASLMLERWPVTIALALTAWVIELVVGVSLGIIAAVRAGTVLDKSILVTTIIAGAIPVFVLGSFAQLIFGVRLGWAPVAGIQAGWPTAYLLPAAVIALFGLASVSRLVRTSMLENMNADYVRFARSKGISEPKIVGTHVMRNSAIPTVTYLATDLGFLLGGTVIIEGIFNLPGVGNLLFEAIRTHEGATVVGVSTALILIFLLSSLVVDGLQALLDPRLRR